MSKRPPQPPRGRGATSNPDNRFEAHRRELVDDGWGSLDAGPEPLATTLTVDSARSIISYNDSPDVPFDRSINPYRGCEHGCIYCFARPTHAYLGHSPGLDFETRLYYKPDAPELLRAELAKRSYRCAPVMLGINTDAYQPVERRLGLTRRILEVLAECHHPVAVVTKSALIERDIDLFAALAERNLAEVAFSITTLDPQIARTLEPRASSPARRLAAMRRFTDAGVPVSVLAAPLIPVLTDPELERILEAAREAGATAAGYVLLRLPHEVKGLFAEWLEMHAPLKAAHVMNRLRDSRGGREYDAAFGRRMRGSGVYADLISQRFRSVVKRLGFIDAPPLDCSQFRPPRAATPQLDLF